MLRIEGRKGKNVFWGVLLLICAVALLVNKLGYGNVLLGGLGVWQIVLSVFFVSSLVNGIVQRSFGQVLFSIAFLIIVNDELLRLEAITPWPVLGAALLGTIGLKFLFPEVKSAYGVKVHSGGREIEGPYSGENIDGQAREYENFFGETVKYVSGEISKVEASNSFGTLQLYFTDAVPSGGSAAVALDNSFGHVIVYVPGDWKVMIKAENNFGGVEEQGQCDSEGETALYIKAENNFGKIHVRYI